MVTRSQNNKDNEYQNTLYAPRCMKNITNLKIRSILTTIVYAIVTTSLRTQLQCFFVKCPQARNPLSRWKWAIKSTTLNRFADN